MWATTRIDDLRKKNDAPGLDPTATALIRGEIRALKALLDLPAQRQAARVGEQPSPSFDAGGY